MVVVRRLLFSCACIHEPLYRLQLPYKMLFEEVQLMKDQYSSRTQFEHCTPVPRIERLLGTDYLWLSRLTTLTVVITTRDVKRTSYKEKYSYSYGSTNPIFNCKLKNRVYSFKTFQTLTLELL